MKFIFKSGSSTRGDSYQASTHLINANFIESIELCVSQFSKNKNPKLYYRLKMVSGSRNSFHIEDSEEIEELESWLLESGITSEQIEELKRSLLCGGFGGDPYATKHDHTR